MEERWRKALEAAVVQLPRFKQGEGTVEIELAFIGSAMPQHHEIIVVNRALRMLGPLRGVKCLIFREDANKSAQRLRIARKVQET